MTILTIKSDDDTMVEILTSTELGMTTDKFCAANREPWDETCLDTRENLWVKLITPLSEIKNGHNKMWAEDNFNEKALMGPYATLAEALDDVTDPLLGCCMNEAFLRPRK